jgi:hypothetical protein
MPSKKAAKKSAARVPAKRRGKTPARTERKVVEPPEPPSAPLRETEQIHAGIKRQHLRSMVRRCELCGKTSKLRKSIVPFSRVQHGVDWAHEKCLRKRDKKTPFKPELMESQIPVQLDPDTCDVDPKMLAVYRDRNGVVYLRVARSKRYADMLACKRWQVERVRMDADTADALYLQPVNRAGILAQARLLLRPSNCSVTISQRALLTLHNVLGTKEIEIMTTKDVAKFATVTGTKKQPAKKPATAEVAAPKKTAAKKAAPKKTAAKKEPTERAPRLSLVTLKKKYKDGKDEKLPAQAQTILSVLESNSGKLTTDKLFAKLEGKLDSAQPAARIYAFYRKRLIDGGYITAAKVA